MSRIKQVIYIGNKKIKFKREYDFRIALKLLRTIHNEYRPLTSYFECYPEYAFESPDTMEYAMLSITGLTLKDAEAILNSAAYKLVEEHETTTTKKGGKNNV